MKDQKVDQTAMNHSLKTTQKKRGFKKKTLSWAPNAEKKKDKQFFSTTLKWFSNQLFLLQLILPFFNSSKNRPNPSRPAFWSRWSFKAF